jgi:hypothetical protein
MIGGAAQSPGTLRWICGVCMRVGQKKITPLSVEGCIGHRFSVGFARGLGRAGHSATTMLGAAAVRDGGLATKPKTHFVSQVETAALGRAFSPPI